MAKVEFAYEYATKPSDIKGLKVATQCVTKYKKLTEMYQRQIEEVEALKGKGASDELYLKYLEAEELQRQFKATYDAGYYMYTYIKENPKTHERKIKTDDGEIKRLKELISGLQTELNKKDTEIERLKRECKRHDMNHTEIRNGAIRAMNELRKVI